MLLSRQTLQEGLYFIRGEYSAMASFLRAKNNAPTSELIRTYMILIPAIITIQIAFGFLINLLLMPLYLVWYFFIVNKITRDLPKTTERLRMLESYKNSAKSHSLVTLIVLELISVGFVVIGIATWAGTGSFLSYALIGFFGFCGWTCGYMIVSKMQRTRTPGD